MAAPIPRELQPKPFLAAFLIAAAGGFSVKAHAQTYASWMTQIGISNTVESAANWGRGQLIGIVDSGIVASNYMFATGQISVASSACAAVTFKCSNGVTDDNGHGTAVASIAAGSTKTPYAISYGGYNTPAGSFIGVAPSANIVAEKVLAASGSAYSTDVANGIRRAADAGASVINLSVSYGNTTDLVAAVNYAAAKGAFIVWSGGNSAAALLNGANSSGLSDAAIKRLIIAGSVNSSGAKSSFSNTPGSAAFISGSGARTAYIDRWIMAPGENILAPYVLGTQNAYYLWSGTSMAAPIITGSLVLLESAWPILKTNGTAANLLLATASDLGAKGHDSTFGTGLANLQTAFNPYGVLAVTKANGQSIAVTSLTGGLITSGALGSLSTIQSALASYTAFDTYSRNFSVNLSGLIKSPTTVATTNPLPTNIYQKPVAIKFNGGELAVSLQPTTSAMQHIGEFGYNADLDQPRIAGFALYTNSAGAIAGFGQGSSNSFTFAKALYDDEAMAMQFNEFDKTSAFSVAQGGGHFSYGSRIGDGMRLAVSYGSTTQSPVSLPGLVPQSFQLKAGFSYRVGSNLTAGVTIGNVVEENGLLGANYAKDSILALGKNETTVLGISAGYRLSDKSNLLFNAEFGQTRANSASGSGLFAGTSSIRSSAYGVTYLQNEIFRAKDSFSVSVKQPLRVRSGSAALVMPAADPVSGIASYRMDWNSLVPDGREVDYTLAYAMPTGKGKTLTLQAAYQKDALNTPGNRNSLIGMVWNGAF